MSWQGNKAGKLVLGMETAKIKSMLVSEVCQRRNLSWRKFCCLKFSKESAYTFQLTKIILNSIVLCFRQMYCVRMEDLFGNYEDFAGFDFNFVKEQSKKVKEFHPPICNFLRLLNNNDCLTHQNERLTKRHLAEAHSLRNLWTAPTS